MGSADGTTSTVAGVKLTNPDRVMYPEQGVTKRRLARYYADHADLLLPHLADRPVSLVRCPTGRTGPCFFQKHPTASLPEQLDTIGIVEKDGVQRPYLVIRSAAGLVATAQIGALELHVWGARRDRLERPERLVFDLDPGEGAAFEAVRRAAHEIRERLRSAGLESFAMLTGGKGLHVIVPLERRRGWEECETFAKGLANAVVRAAPDRYVARASKAERKGKVFIDWLRNQRGSTAVVPFSPRARPGAPVAAPVGWDELAHVDGPALYAIDTIESRLASLKRDPWPNYFALRQRLRRSALERFTP